MKPQPISVMLFSNAVGRAGAEEVVLHLLQGLSRERFRLHFACTPELARCLRNDLPPDISLLTLSLDHLYDFRGAFRLAQAFRKHRIQLLNSHMFRASLFASPLARLVRVPVVLDTSHGRELWRTGWKRSFVVDRLVARANDYTIAVSDSTAGYLVSEKHIPSRKVKVVRNGVNLERYRQETRDRTSIRCSLQVDQDVPLLVVLGRLEPQKGHRFLIQAMSTVRREFPDVQVVCLGEGALRNELELLAKSQGLENTIRFPGYERDVLRWLRAADLSVLPSLFEGLPMVAIETLAAGCPMVATAVDGTPEVVLHNETGLLVPPRDPDSLANAILQMLRNPIWARDMAQAGRRLVFDHFSVEQMVRRTEELYLQSWQEYLARRCGHVRRADAPADVVDAVGSEPGPADSRIG